MSLLEVRDLVKHYPLGGGFLGRDAGAVRALDGVSFAIESGETLGLVGESGCGKSTAGRALLQLVRPTRGSVLFRGVELTSLGPRELRSLRRDMQMVFQDPHSSLNPRMKVGDIVGEPLEVHGLSSTAERRSRVSELLELVGLDRDARERLPHEFSGGQRQRVGIARALATSPKLLVADEPTSALDVSIQAQVLNLLSDLKERLGLTYLFISHDLSVVRHLSDRVAVMYLGRIAEISEKRQMFRRPLHPYTQALLSAVPAGDPDLEGIGEKKLLRGEVADPANPPPGCRFHPRCPFATSVCREQEPELRSLEEGSARHLVACHHAGSLVETQGAEA